MMPPVKGERRILLSAALLLAAAAIAARAPGAVAYSLWQDEVASARILIEPTPWDAVARVADTESTPPAWYLAGWLLHWVGVPVEGVRWLSVLCGAAASALTLVFARRFLSLPGAALAGAAVALGWQFVARGHELRAYSLYLLLAVAFALLLVRAAERPERGRLAALAAVTALALLTHYFFALALLTGAAWLVAAGLRDTVSQGRGSTRQGPPASPAGGREPPSDTVSLSRTWPALVAVAAGALPLLAWLPGFLQQVANDRYSWVASFDLLKAAAVYSTFFWNAEELYVEAQDVSISPLAAVARLAVLAVVVAGAVVLWRRGGEARLAALLATVPVALAALLWLSGGSVFTTRNLICAAPFAAVAIAAAVTALPRPAAVAAGAVALGFLALGLTQEWTLRPPPYEEYAGRLRAAGVERGSLVYVVGGAHDLSYLGSAYALRSPIAWYLPGHPELRLAEPPACDGSALVVDGSARPVRVGRERCEDLPEGGYWFRLTGAGGQASPRLRRAPHTTQSVVV
jgi:hypothetical protein